MISNIYIPVFILLIINLGQSDGAGVGEDPKVDKNVWEVEPNEESEKPKAQPRPLYPD